VFKRVQAFFDVLKTLSDASTIWQINDRSFSLVKRSFFCCKRIARKILEKLIWTEKAEREKKKVVDKKSTSIIGIVYWKRTSTEKFYSSKVNKEWNQRKFNFVC